MENVIVKSSGELSWGDKTYKVAIGKNGIIQAKREGDNATPVGCFPIRKIYYRTDRIAKPNTDFETVALERNDGWSDDVNDPAYNTHVKLPYTGSHEELWRDDHLYDIIVVLGYNDDPPVPGNGSAIFMHVARENYSPTAGCIALAISDLLDILRSIDSKAQICVVAD